MMNDEHLAGMPFSAAGRGGNDGQESGAAFAFSLGRTVTDVDIHGR